MAFEALLNQPASEKDLLKHAVASIQSEFIKYQNASYFMKIQRLNDTESQIIWIRMFNERHQLHEFFWDSIYQRACFMVVFDQDHYEAIWYGFQLSDRFALWPDKTTDHRTHEGFDDPEKNLMLPRELAAGFAEIEGHVSSVKSSKAV